MPPHCCRPHPRPLPHGRGEVWIGPHPRPLPRGRGEVWIGPHPRPLPHRRGEVWIGPHPRPLPHRRGEVWIGDLSLTFQESYQAIDPLSPRGKGPGVGSVTKIQHSSTRSYHSPLLPNFAFAALPNSSPARLPPGDDLLAAHAGAAARGGNYRITFILIHEHRRLQQARFVFKRNRQETVLIGVDECPGSTVRPNTSTAQPHAPGTNARVPRTGGAPAL